MPPPLLLSARRDSPATARIDSPPASMQPLSPIRTPSTGLCRPHAAPYGSSRIVRSGEEVGLGGFEVTPAKTLVLIGSRQTLDAVRGGGDPDPRPAVEYLFPRQPDIRRRVAQQGWPSRSWLVGTMHADAENGAVPGLGQVRTTAQLVGPLMDRRMW